MSDLLKVSPENYWREVWHTYCPRRGPMRRVPGSLAIEDGSILSKYECVACGMYIYAGLDARRIITTRAVMEQPAAPPPASPPTETEQP